MNWVRVWELGLDPSFFADCRSYRQILSRLYEEWMRREGKIRWGDKTPQYIAEIPTLLEIFPSSKIIHIYRDGRDVALSWVRNDFGPENIFTAVRRWKYFVNMGCRVGATLPPETYLEISYEKLLSHPEATMRRVCAFLNEPFCRDVLTPKRLEIRAIRVHKHKRASGSEIVKSNAGKWKESMSPSDCVLFESIAGDLLRTLGYETEGKTRHISQSEQFKWKMHHTFWRYRQILHMKYRGAWVITRLLLRWADLRCRLRSARPSSLAR
jgi:hypothetical protein